MRQQLQALLLSLLEKEVKPSSGCTEVAAIGLSVAAASKNINKNKVKVKIHIDFDTFKNAAAVGVPGGGVGIRDCVRKALYGNPSEGLKVLTSSKKRFEGKIDLDVKPINIPYLFIYTIIDDKNSSLICYRHDNITYVGTPLSLDKAIKMAVKEKSKDHLSSIFDKEKKEIKIPYKSIVESVKYLVEIPQVNSKIEEGITLNSKLAEENLKSEKYKGISKRLPERTILEKMIKYTTAAVESRMSGSSIPAMAVAGSGNQGITTTLPLVIYSREKEITERKMKEAILLSWLTTIYATSFTKYVSPICGQGIKAGVGLASGLAYLINKKYEKKYEIIENAIINHLASLTGMICDGAKPSCCLKVASAIDTAYRATILSLNNIRMNKGEGIIGESVEETLKYLGEYVAAADYLNEKIVEIIKEGIND